jgi:hypothetical protein
MHGAGRRFLCRPSRAQRGRAQLLLSRERTPRENDQPTHYGVAPGYTSERCRTHVTETGEVLYAWHPWFGRVVYIHEVIERGGERIRRCDLSEKQTARCMHIPAWMFDRAACLRIRWADRPQVELTVHTCLKALLAGVGDRTSAVTTVVGARHPFEMPMPRRNRQ